MKAFADDKFDAAYIMISSFDRVENIFEKEKVLLPAFSFFPKIFSKALRFNFFLKVRIVWESVKIQCVEFLVLLHAYSHALDLDT